MGWDALTKSQKRTRRRYARKSLPGLIEAQGGRCLDCKRDLTNYDPQTMGPLERPTVEHIVPLSQGGSNQRDNLCALCCRCNLRRDRETKPSRLVCKKCQGPKESKRRKCCNKCRLGERYQEILASGKFNERLTPVRPVPAD